MDSQGVVEFGDQLRGQLAYSYADPLDGNGADLLGLRFGVMGQSGLTRWEQMAELGAHDVDVRIVATRITGRRIETG